MRTIKSKTAPDGTELKLKQRDDGNYIVTEAGSDTRIDEYARDREEGEKYLRETSRAYGWAERARKKRERRSTGFGGGNMDAGFDGGFFGGSSGMDDDLYGTDDMSGGFFGGGSAEDTNRQRTEQRSTSSDLFGGGDMDGGLFGGSSDSNSKQAKDTNGGGGLFSRLGLGSSSSGNSGRRRDPDNGRFAPNPTERADFEMERDSNGRYTGRADDEEDDSGGLFDFLRR